MLSLNALYIQSLFRVPVALQEWMGNLVYLDNLVTLDLLDNHPQDQMA